MKTARLNCLLLAALLFFASRSALEAQSYSINWFKISGGGGAASGGQYSLISTIGQHDASGPMTGGGYSLTGGFLALFALQTPGAPQLFIKRSGGAVTVFWQDVAGWTLQQNADLAAPADWSASTGVTTASGANSLTLSSPAGHLFFRLQYQ